jgi:hypothetical protein
LVTIDTPKRSKRHKGIFDDFFAIVARIRDDHARRIEQQANGRAAYSVRVPSVGDRVCVLVSGARTIGGALKSPRIGNLINTQII